MACRPGSLLGVRVIGAEHRCQEANKRAQGGAVVERLSEMAQVKYEDYGGRLGPYRTVPKLKIFILENLHSHIPYNVFHHSTSFLGQKVDFTRKVEVLYGSSDTSRYQ
jgi:hypothetical protein